MCVFFLGDLSKEDALILCEYGKTASRVLEFGVGGSTQIFAQVAKEDTEIISVDTSHQWIETTQANLKEMGIHRCVHFFSYNEKIEGSFDLIFVDGHKQHRCNFARLYWQQLEVGGFMLFHDTRRTEDINNPLTIIHENQHEVEYALINVNSSNITVLKKKQEEPYVNWNKKEGKEPWQYGKSFDKPDDWVKQLKNFFHVNQ